MDMVYEGFIAGVVKDELGHQYRVKTQVTDWLTEEQVFQIRNDLLLTNRQTETTLAVDTKYKVRAFEPGDSKASITQMDLYQMVSHGLRRSSQHVVILYPRPFVREPELPQRFTVNSDLLDKQPIHIQAVDLTVTGSMKTSKEFNERIV